MILVQRSCPKQVAIVRIAHNQWRGRSSFDSERMRVPRQSGYGDGRVDHLPTEIKSQISI